MSSLLMFRVTCLALWTRWLRFQCCLCCLLKADSTLCISFSMQFDLASHWRSSSSSCSVKSICRIDRRIRMWMQHRLGRLLMLRRSCRGISCRCQWRKAKRLSLWFRRILMCLCSIPFSSLLLKSRNLKMLGIRWEMRIDFRKAIGVRRSRLFRLNCSMMHLICRLLWESRIPCCCLCCN